MADHVPKRQVVLVTVAALIAAVVLLIVDGSRPTPHSVGLISPNEENADLQISGAGSPGCRKLRALLVGPFGATFTKISPTGAPSSFSIR